jgi:hypothetical protein
MIERNPMFADLLRVAIVRIPSAFVLMLREDETLADDVRQHCHV